MELSEAIELVEGLSRTKKYPDSENGIRALAEGLRTASRLTGVTEERIVSRCSLLSEYCPTDADMLAIAREMQPAAQRRSACPSEKCDGSGWIQVYYLRNWVGNATTGHWDSQIISQEVYDASAGRLGKDQQAHSARYRCRCHPASQERIEKVGKKYA